MTATKWLRELCTLVGLLQMKGLLTATNHSSATQQLSSVIEPFFISASFHITSRLQDTHNLLYYSFSSTSAKFYFNLPTCNSRLCQVVCMSWCVNSNAQRWPVSVANPFVWMPGCSLVEVYTQHWHSASLSCAAGQDDM